MTIQIRPVQTSADRKAFLHLPWQIYRGDPHWVPPLRMNQKEVVGYKKHPFYDDAEIQTSLAFKDGKPCGRIGAILNHAHNRTHPEDQCGFVGFFESIDDVAVAHGLFDAARDWLQSKGQTVMRGPVNPSLNYECGLLVHNFDMSPTFMMTYNPEYYVRLWEEYGFQKVQDLYTFTGYEEQLDTMEKKIQFVAEAAVKRFKIDLRPIRKKSFAEDVRHFVEIYNSSLEAVWGHVPMSSAEIEHMAQGLKFLIVPELTLFAEVDGKPVGSIIGLLDYNRRIKLTDGRLFPFGFLKLLVNRKAIKRIRLLSTNVLPEYQRWGVGVVLAAHLLAPCLKWGINEGEFSWVLETNHLSRKTLERGDLVREKTHRIYDYGGNSTA